MRKRYQVQFSEEFYSLARREAAGTGVAIGMWIENMVYPSGVPANASPPPIYPVDPVKKAINWEASVDEPVKKAIEPEKVRTTGNKNKLSKGLGEIPGLTDKTEDPYRRFTPAPKPGTKK